MKLKESIVGKKSKEFAVRIVRLYQFLSNDKNEYILSKQLLRCGTSIGANIHEALRGQTKADFRAKMNIALKEASETQYWLELLYDTDYLEQKAFDSINEDCTELVKLLISIVKSSENS